MKDAYIIGDVHGCFETLQALLKQLPKNAKKIFVGDLIDRGPKSKEVIDLVRKNNYDCVKGNHESSMITCNGKIDLESKDINIWQKFGGIATYQSYERYCSENNIGLESELKKDMEYLDNLPLALTYNNLMDDKGRKLLVTHSSSLSKIEEYLLLAGKNLQKHDNQYTEFENLGNTFLNDRVFPVENDTEYFNVFGHTNVYYMRNHIDPRLYNMDSTKITKQDIYIDTDLGLADIDSGAAFDLQFSHKLTALEFPGMNIVQQKNIDN